MAAHAGDFIDLQSYNSQLYVVESRNVTFIDCIFHDFNEVLYPGFRNPGIQTAITVYQSHVTLIGISKFYNNQHSALISYSSVITLAGSVSFVNNTATRGGAIALYSSSLHLTPGTNVSFINNTAHETGGAIHIEPDLTRMLKLECFFFFKLIILLQRSKNSPLFQE